MPTRRESSPARCKSGARVFTRAFRVQVARGFVLTADHVPEPFDGEGQVHNQADFGREGWTKAVQGAISINDPAVDDFETAALIIKGLH